MKRRYLVPIAAALALAGAGTALGVASLTTKTATVCATVTSPAHTIGVDGKNVYTIPGATASKCATVTYTQGTTTVTTTVGTTTQPATTTQPTTTAPSGGSGAANMFVATSGNDSTATRSDAMMQYADAKAAGHVFATPAAAIRAAHSGDLVIVEDGTYPSHLDGAAEGHQNFAANVTLQPEPGHECQLTYPNVPAPWSDTSCPVNISGDSGDGQLGLSLGGNDDYSDGVTGHPLPDSLTAAQMATWDTHLTIKGIYIGEMTAINAAHINLVNDVGTVFYIREGVYDFNILGGDYANQTDASNPTIGDSLTTGANWAPAENVLVEGAVIHDFITQGSGHGDGLFIQPSYNVALVKNVLARNDCIPIYVNYAQNAAVGVHGLIIAGNVVHTDTIHNGGARCYQGISLGDNDQTNSLVAFNSLEGPIRRSNSGSEINSGNRIVGNVADGINAVNAGNTWGCGPGTTASYNVLMDSAADACGDSSNSLVYPLVPFVSIDTQPNSPSGTDKMFTAPLGDYSLTAGAAAIGKVPTSWVNGDTQLASVLFYLSTDINGNPRPNPAHPNYWDAGAYENR
jgi:hypothetical protein